MQGPCTVGKYLTVLVHEVTRYDRREEARELKRPGGRVNIYRLGHLLGAAQKVEKDLEKFAADDVATNERARDKLKASLGRRFTPHFSPVTRTLRQIERGICRLEK